MSKIFFADKQTLNDLNIPGRHKNNSVARIFDTVVTSGARKLLDTMFQLPLTDEKLINERSNIFQYFEKQALTFPFGEEEFATVENYLSTTGSNNIIAAGMNGITKKMLQIVAQDKEYELLNKEVCKTIDVLNRFNDFATQLKAGEAAYKAQLEEIIETFRNPELSWLKHERGVTKLTMVKLIRYDHKLRSDLREQMKRLTVLIFHLDVYIAVSAVSKKRGFSYALAMPRNNNSMTVTDLYHPGIENGIGNSVSLGQDRNMIFLTGANMAGKSTLMKSFGICVYLAHMGFPVPASHMEFSVKDALYSSINVSDNLDMGYSHFYAEVLRVKTVAEEVAAEKDMFVIFDELFKGTNVKDAYDATLSITEAFSENRNCFFIISTHIVEVGEELRQRCQNFKFVYLPTIMEGSIPRYTYKIKEGITQDKQGMIIIENEGILEVIKGRQNGFKYERKSIS